jgi:hypothetical protein
MARYFFLCFCVYTSSKTLWSCYRTACLKNTLKLINFSQKIDNFLEILNAFSVRECVCLCARVQQFIQRADWLVCNLIVFTEPPQKWERVVTAAVTHASCSAMRAKWLGSNPSRLFRKWLGNSEVSRYAPWRATRRYTGLCTGCHST